MLTLDHLVVACAELETGTAEIGARLGVALDPGGQHADMGTHNRLMSLGPETYLEVIAIAPGAPAPSQPRWYDLDRFEGAPRLTHWAARVPDLEAALAALPGAGRIWDLARGDLRWRMAIPEDGRLPFGDLAPALLQWPSGPPTARMADHGFRLRRLEVHGPEAPALGAALEGLIADPRIAFTEAPARALRAEIETPGGVVTL